MNDKELRTISFVGVAIGAAIYLLLREPVIFTMPLKEMITSWPVITLPESPVRTFTLYYLPDFLWCASLMCYATTVRYIPFRVAACLLPPVMELTQLLDFIPGTFCILDLTIYLLTIILFIKLWNRNHTKNTFSSHF